MAAVTASDAPPAALCFSSPRLLPLDGMTAMYLLMSLFHLPPWLKLASARPGARSRPTTGTDRQAKETDDEACDRFA